MKDLPRPNPNQTKPAPFVGKLFLSFLKLGLTAFGGPAMVAYTATWQLRRTIG